MVEPVPPGGLTDVRHLAAVAMAGRRGKGGQHERLGEDHAVATPREPEHRAVSVQVSGKSDRGPLLGLVEPVELHEVAVPSASPSASATG